MSLKHNYNEEEEYDDYLPDIEVVCSQGPSKKFKSDMDNHSTKENIKIDSEFRSHAPKVVAMNSPEKCVSPIVNEPNFSEHDINFKSYSKPKNIDSRDKPRYSVSDDLRNSKSSIKLNNTSTQLTMKGNNNSSKKNAIVKSGIEKDTKMMNSKNLELANPLEEFDKRLDFIKIKNSKERLTEMRVNKNNNKEIDIKTIQTDKQRTSQNFHTIANNSRINVMEVSSNSNADFSFKNANLFYSKDSSKNSKNELNSSAFNQPNKLNESNKRKPLLCGNNTYESLKKKFKCENVQSQSFSKQSKDKKIALDKTSDSKSDYVENILGKLKDKSNSILSNSVRNQQFAGASNMNKIISVNYPNFKSHRTENISDKFKEKNVFPLKSVKSQSFAEQSNINKVNDNSTPLNAVRDHSSSGMSQINKIVNVNFPNIKSSYHENISDKLESRSNSIPSKPVSSQSFAGVSEIHKMIHTTTSNVKSNYARNISDKLENRSISIPSKPVDTQSFAEMSNMHKMVHATTSNVKSNYARNISDKLENRNNSIPSKLVSSQSFAGVSEMHKMVHSATLDVKSNYVKNIPKLENRSNSIPSKPVGSQSFAGVPKKHKTVPVKSNYARIISDKLDNRSDSIPSKPVNSQPFSVVSIMHKMAHAIKSKARSNYVRNIPKLENRTNSITSKPVSSQSAGVSKMHKMIHTNTSDVKSNNAQNISDKLEAGSNSIPLNPVSSQPFAGVSKMQEMPTTSNGKFYDSKNISDEVKEISSKTITSQSFTGVSIENSITHGNTLNVDPNCVEIISQKSLNDEHKLSLIKTEKPELQSTSDDKHSKKMSFIFKIKEFILHFIRELNTTKLIDCELANSMKCAPHYIDNDIIDEYSEICSICYWPYNMNIAFTSRSVQNAMLEKILHSFLKTTIQFPLIARCIIQHFPADVQLKLKTQLPDYLSSNQGNQNDEEDFGVADTFSEYKPTKLLLGHSHPDSVVETASLSSIEPPDITYKLSIPDEVIQSKKLSSLQLETIVYACQRHEQLLSSGKRAGFLIGDGAGVGKGRTIAGMIFENYLKGRQKSVWVSVSNDLKFDAERDLKDIGADNIKVHSLNKLSYSKSYDVDVGVLFATYAALIGHCKGRSKNMFKTRLNQIVDWCGKKFDGCIIFDECHKAKNLIGSGGRKPTKTGVAVEKIQTMLPKARVFYSSATGASEPKNMAYMTRLGIWDAGGTFKDFEHFRTAVNKRGVGVMEMIALDLKLRGAYMARQLSFHEVTFRIEEIKLTPKYREMYDQSCKLWEETLKYYQHLIPIIDHPVERTTLKRLYWASHQRFFKYLCIGAKVDPTVALCQDALKDDKCVVIGLQMTGEASTESVLRKNGQISDFVSTAKSVLEAIITRYSERDIYNNNNLIKMRRDLLNKLSKLEPLLPSNSLDELINKLGGVEKVAEMTGRKGRVVQHLNGDIDYESRKEEGEDMELVNISEKKKFMEGKKLIAIISDASSTGVSLQSDLRVSNQKRRVHITLELPWSADKAIQQFGRTHRSNQANAPEYVLVISELGGERRFASAVAKRLESLGALTHGDRRVMEARDLSPFNIESKYGTLALKRILEDIFSRTDSLSIKMQLALTKVQISKEEILVKNFLNRLLGIPIAFQNALFKRFSSTLDELIRRDQQSGEYDSGTLDLGIGGQSCRPIDEVKWELKHQTGEVEIILYTVSVERGISWTEALSKYELLKNFAADGFYVSKHNMSKKKTVCLALLKTNGSKKFEQYTIFKPNIGQAKPVIYGELLRNFKKVDDLDEVKMIWDNMYEHTKSKCLHSYGGGFCRVVGKCYFGLRSCTHFILCGFIMKVWTDLEKLFAKAPTYYRTIRIIRLKTFDGKRLVGVRIPSILVNALKTRFDILSDPSKQEQLEDKDSDSILDKPLALRKSNSKPKNQNGRKKLCLGSRKNAQTIDVENNASDDFSDDDIAIINEISHSPSDINESMELDLDDVVDLNSSINNGDEDFVIGEDLFENDAMENTLSVDKVPNDNETKSLNSNTEMEHDDVPISKIKIEDKEENMEESVCMKIEGDEKTIKDETCLKIEDKKCTAKVEDHFKEFKIDENYSLKFEVLYNTQYIKVENNLIKPGLMEIDISANTKVRLESVTPDNKTGNDETADKEPGNIKREKIDESMPNEAPSERSTEVGTSQINECNLNVQPSFSSKDESKPNEAPSKCSTEVGTSQINECNLDVQASSSSKDESKPNEAPSKCSTEVGTSQINECNLDVQASSSSKDESKPNEAPSKCSTEVGTSQINECNLDVQASSSSKDESKPNEAPSKCSTEVGTSQINECNFNVQPSSSSNNIITPENEKNISEINRNEKELISSDTCSSSATKELDSINLNEASTSNLCSKNDGISGIDIKTEVNKNLTKSFIPGIKIENRSPQRTRKSALDYEDISCIIDSRCNLNEIKNLLGLEIPSVSSGKNITDNWKDALKNLNSEVKSLKDFIKFQFGMP